MTADDIRKELEHHYPHLKGLFEEKGFNFAVIGEKRGGDKGDWFGTVSKELDALHDQLERVRSALKEKAEYRKVAWVIEDVSLLETRVKMLEVGGGKPQSPKLPPNSAEKPTAPGDLLAAHTTHR
jgi:hypothetical protein